MELAIEAGQRDEVELTNLILFAQNPQLLRTSLDPKAKNFKTLSGQWRTILTKDVRSAIERMSVDHDMAVHGKFGQPCPVCESKVQRIRYANNETNYCPTCQTDGKLLADRSLSLLLKRDWPRTPEELEELRRR